MSLDLEFDARKHNLLEGPSGAHSFTDGVELYVGQRFINKEEFLRMIRNASTKNNFETQLKKSSSDSYMLICVDPSCKWRVRAYKLQNSSFFTIRKDNNTHTCSLEKRSARHQQASSSFVAEIVNAHYKGCKEAPKPKDIITLGKNVHKVSITYWKAWYGRKLAHDLLRGSLESSFHHLPAYYHMLKRLNPRTIIDIVVVDRNRFKYFFMALGASIKGYSVMRKVISVDGTFLKSKYKGVMMIATLQDGNHHYYPIAFGIVDLENDVSWNWFLRKLQEIIPDDKS
ncbi:hypothetical protein UlMin_045809 [Ulmus minor]